MEVHMDILSLRRQGFSKRYIAKKLGIHRNTVTKYLLMRTAPGYAKPRAKPSILDPYKPLICSLLDQDDYRATWILDRIQAAGYSGGYDTLKIYVRKIKKRLTRLAYTRFETSPGLQGQVDWADF
jgi:transposase